MDSDERREFAISIQTDAHCDVAVVGGGIAGVFAALAAARAGAETVLVEQHGFVGGQGTAGGVHTFCGETRLVNDAWREMLARLDAFGAIAPYRPNADGRAFSSEYLKFVLQEMLAEAGVRVLLHTHFVELERAGDQVAALVLFNKSGCFRLTCRQAIDASGDADLVARGGWGYDKGGPALLPGGRGIDRSAGAKQLPMSQYFSMLNVRKPARAHLPPGCPEWAGDEQVPMTSISGDENAIVIKMKVIGYDATDGFSLAAAEQAARRQMMGLVYHLQTKGYHGNRYETFRLLAAAPHIGVREGRRARTKSPLRAEDVLRGGRFTDAVAVGSYHIDYHWPTVVQRA
ncbi:MAG TPA: FAD-dependent oxidoreductase, partial [Limnochordia bacterium]|nr:FAD-dependent oxidoreductase [Limnochordia bacterium]